MSNDNASSSVEGLLEFIKKELKPIKVEVKNKRRIFIELRKEDLREAAKRLYELFEPLRGRLSTVSAVDVKVDFEVLYHFTFSQLGLVLTVRCRVPKHEPYVDSISDIIHGATLIEREIHDLFGIYFRGHPNMDRLVLPDDWPDGVYPLKGD